MHKLRPVVGRTTRSSRQGVWTQGQAHISNSAFCCHVASIVESCETVNGFFLRRLLRSSLRSSETTTCHDYLGSSRPCSRPSGLAEPVLHDARGSLDRLGPDTRIQGCTNLWSLVKCLDHRGIASETVCTMHEFDNLQIGLLYALL